MAVAAAGIRTAGTVARTAGSLVQLHVILYAGVVITPQASVMATTVVALAAVVFPQGIARTVHQRLAAATDGRVLDAPSAVDLVRAPELFLGIVGRVVTRRLRS